MISSENVSTNEHQQFRQNDSFVSTKAAKAIKKIEGKLYELRPGSNRVLFFYYSQDGEFILLHGFKKKTQKIPKKQKDKAIKEMNRE